MWKTEEVGVAIWSDAASRWYFDLRGGEHGISLLANEKTNPDSMSVDQRHLSLVAVDEMRLPLASEHYVRGEKYFVNFPQGDGRYAIRLVLHPVTTSENLLVLSAKISIQTDLLDTHPMLDLVAEGRDVVTLDRENAQENWRNSITTQSTGSPPIVVVRGETASTAVLLGPHDSPFTSNRSNAERLCLRLFGDFLEKGVIRTAVPWIVVDRSADPQFSERLPRWHQQLCESPLPLS
jgi:hypothetical protein